MDNKCFTIINMCGEQEAPYYFEGRKFKINGETKEIQYHRFPAEDSTSFDIGQYFDPIFEIVRNVDPDENILIHCKLAKARSPAIVVACIIRFYKLSICRIHKRLLEVTSPTYNIRFKDILDEFELKELNKSTIDQTFVRIEPRPNYKELYDSDDPNDDDDDETYDEPQRRPRKKPQKKEDTKQLKLEEMFEKIERHIDPPDYIRKKKKEEQ